MDQESKQLISEVKDLMRQYQAEVGEGGRKAWPKSIKERVLRLCEKGMPSGEVSRLTGVPYHSTLPWRRKAGLLKKSPAKKEKKSGFHTLTVTEQAPPNTVTVVDPPRTVTVEVYGIGRVNLPDVRSAAELISFLKKSGACDVV